MNEKLLYKYINGNCTVEIFDDGTKVRTYEGTPAPQFPESIDVKITNYCTGGCPYCHEMSGTNGKHADLLKSLNLFQNLPPGVELALGGGDPLDHPLLESFLLSLKSLGMIANMTINQQHVQVYPKYKQVMSLIEQGLVKGLGLSYIKQLPLKNLIAYKNLVVHLILGVHTISDLTDLIDRGARKILVLGYKSFGRGVLYEKQNSSIQGNIQQWCNEIPEVMKSRKIVYSFDNLAISQLKLQRLFTKKTWERFYMGDEGAFTMYLDLVKNEYACSSTSQQRFPVTANLATMFTIINKGASIKL